MNQRRTRPALGDLIREATKKPEAAKEPTIDFIGAIKAGSTPEETARMITQKIAEAMGKQGFSVTEVTGEAEQTSSCHCRERWLETCEPHKLESAVDSFGAFFPDVVSGAIGQLGKELSLTGIIGAHEVSRGKDGRGVLAKSIAAQDGIGIIAGVMIDAQSRMASHGGDITRDDGLKVMRAQLGAILAYFLTDMVKTPDLKH